MAPPTILYNNTNAKYTKYEQINFGQIGGTEVAIAKAMLTQDINTFNTSAPSNGNKDTTFSLVVPSTDSTPQLTHLMINHQQNDLGSVFAIGAEHNFDNTINVSGSASNHVSFNTSSGSIGSNLGTSTPKPVYVTNDSASYYDSQIVVSTDNIEHVFKDNEEVPVGTNKKYEVTYDSSSSNFNAEKAVNSRYSNYKTTAATANPNGDKTDPLVVYESTTFNSGDSLYTERVVSRNLTTNELTASGTINDAMKTLVNNSNQKYYDSNTDFIGSGFIGIKQEDESGTNNRAFFGAVRVTQTSDDVIHITGGAAGSTGPATGSTGPIDGTTLAMVPQNPGSALPTSMTKTQFDNLFTGAELPYVGEDYSLDVRAYTDDETTGGYYTYGSAGHTGPFRGFTTDDTYVKRNTTYMRKCAEEGNNFDNSVQTVEIHNGDLVATSVFTGPNADLLVNRVDVASTDASGNPTPHDTDENLDVNQYTSDYWVRTYFTEPNTNVTATYHRAEEAEGNTSSYTNFKVTYDASEGGSVLPDDRRERYYDKFDITTVFPNTNVTGDVFSGSNYIGEDNGFAAVFQSDASGNFKTGINLNTDYTFTSSSQAAASLNDEEIAIIHLSNSMMMSNENTLFTDATTSTGIVGSTVSALGEDIDLTKLANSSNSTLSDLRINIDIKGETTAPVVDSILTNSWTVRRSAGTFFAVDPFLAVNILGSDIYDIMSNINNNVTMNITMVTNGTSLNRDALTLDAKIDWSWNNISNTYTIPSASITQQSVTNNNNVPVGEIETLIKDIHYKISTAASNNTLIASKLSNATLKKKFETRTFTPQFNLPIGAYTNFAIRGVPMTMITSYHILEDAGGARLPDSYIHYLEGLNGRTLNATRHILNVESKASTILTLSAKDLFAAKAVIQKKDDATWVNVSDSLDFDPVFNNTTVFNLFNSAGKISISSDITNALNPAAANKIVLGNTNKTYYVSLTVDKISYAVVGKKWDITNVTDASALTTWASTNSIYSTNFPDAGSEISLVANVSYTSPESSNLNVQPDLTLTVTDPSGNIWAKFKTDSKNITSSFNVLFARRPVFHVVETYKNVSITVPNYTGAVTTEDEVATVVDTYLMAGSSTMLQVIDGIQLTFNNDTAIGDSASYRLLGDRVEASLYSSNASSYAGPYSTLKEVTFANGLVIGDSKARHIDIKYYRGNSVRTAVAPATYEEFRWTRSPTKIQMKIVNNNSASTTYTDSLSNIYNGSIHTVTDLSGSIGDLGLKFYGNLSRFRNVNVLGSNQDVNMHQLITIVFDAYKWSISNPYNTTTAGAVNALSDASGVVFTNYYSIVNYTGSNPMNIVASRVWIREEADEVFKLEYKLPTLKVDYLAEQYVGNPIDPSTFTWSDATRIDSITYADLNTGRYIKHPTSTKDNGDPEDSLIFIRRAPISVQDHVGYFLLPRPQHVVEAIATDAVSGLPYNFTNATRTTRYFDINLETNSTVGHKPFAGGFGLSNGTRVINDMNIRFNNDEKYVDRRYQSAENLRKIYIPSNKVTVKLYKGYSSHTSLNSNLNISTVYQGYIHKLANYDVDAEFNEEQTGKSNYEKSTTAIDSTIYNTYFDGSKTTYIDGDFNKRNDMTYDLYFSQDHTIISPQITSDAIYGELGNKIVNIQTEGYAPFMNLDSVSVASRHLDLLTGDSVKLVLYGHTFTTDACGNLVAEFVKYTTGTGYDFSNNETTEFLITNLGFNASTRETATVVLSNKSTTLTATPYNFIVDCNNKADSLSSLNWVTDSTWASKSTAEKQLAFNMVCLSTVGQSKLTEILGVSARSPFRILVCNYPNRIDLRSGDGSPLYVVNAFGKLTCLVVNSQVIELTPQSYNSSDNVEEYGAYNTLLGNTV